MLELQQNHSPEQAHIVERKLTEIADHLARMDRRDRLRTAGSFLKTTIWLAIIIGSTWYFMNHAAELMGEISKQAAQAASQYTQSQGQDLMNQIIKQANPAKK